MKEIVFQPTWFEICFFSVNTALLILCNNYQLLMNMTSSYQCDQLYHTLYSSEQLMSLVGLLFFLPKFLHFTVVVEHTCLYFLE